MDEESLPPQSSIELHSSHAFDGELAIHQPDISHASSIVKLHEVSVSSESSPPQSEFCVQEAQAFEAAVAEHQPSSHSESLSLAQAPVVSSAQSSYVQHSEQAFIGEL